MPNFFEQAFNFGGRRQDRQYRDVLDRLGGTTEQFYQRLLALPRPDSQGLMAGTEGAIAGYDQAGLGSFFGPEYQAALEHAMLASAAPQVLSTARAASLAGAGRGAGAFGGGTAGQVRRAMGETGNLTQAAILNSRAQAEGQRAGIAQQGANAKLQARTGALNLGSQQQASFQQQLMQALAGLGGGQQQGISGAGASRMGAGGFGMDESDLLTLLLGAGSLFL